MTSSSIICQSLFLFCYMKSAHLKCAQNKKPITQYKIFKIIIKCQGWIVINVYSATVYHTSPVNPVVLVNRKSRGRPLNNRVQNERNSSSSYSAAVTKRHGPEHLSKIPLHRRLLLSADLSQSILQSTNWPFASHLLLIKDTFH